MEEFRLHGASVPAAAAHSAGRADEKSDLISYKLPPCRIGCGEVRRVGLE